MCNNFIKLSAQQDPRFSCSSCAIFVGIHNSFNNLLQFSAIVIYRVIQMIETAFQCDAHEGHKMMTLSVKKCNSLHSICRGWWRYVKKACECVSLQFDQHSTDTGRGALAVGCASQLQ